MNAHTNKKTAYVAPSGHDRRGVCGCDPRDVAVAARAGPGGPVQFRLSEGRVRSGRTHAGCRSRSHPSGCAIANLIALAINGTGALGLLDVAFGSLATFLGALWCCEAARPSETRAARAGDRQCAHRARLPSPPSARPWLLHHSVHICCARWAVPAHVPVLASCPRASGKRSSCTRSGCPCFRRSDARGLSSKQPHNRASVRRRAID